jgi:hypothetical protein
LLVVLIVIHFSCDFVFSNFIDGSWRFVFAFSLGCGGDVVHFFDLHGVMILLGDYPPEFWGECSLENVHFEVVEHHGIVLPQERVVCVDSG